MTNRRNSSLIVLALFTLACDPAGSQFTVGAGLLPHDGHEPATDTNDDTSDDSSEPDVPENDPPLLDLGTDDSDDPTHGGEPHDSDDDSQQPMSCTTHAECSDLAGPCSLGICGPGRTCESLPVNDGDPCDDIDSCTIGSTCSAGQCSGGQPLDCSAFDAPCVVGECNPTDGTCEVVAIDGCVVEPRDVAWLAQHADRPLLISEFMVDPQWIEVFNASPWPVDLGGLEIIVDGSDAVGVVHDATIIAPNGYAWLGAGPAEDWADSPADVDGWYGPGPQIDVDATIRLRFGGVEFDKIVTFGLTVIEGQSRTLDPQYFDWLANNNQHHWCWTPILTPGDPNDDCPPYHP